MATGNGHAAANTHQRPQSSQSQKDDILPLFGDRPKLVRRDELLLSHPCASCSDILVNPYQTSCGQQVCKQCIDRAFGDQSIIPCPLSHDDLDEEELKSEPCLIEGLFRDEVTPDHIVQHVLLREKCFCTNKEYGCSETVEWRRLKDHERRCAYVPVSCKNQGCYKLVASVDLETHLVVCEFSMVPCQFCSKLFRRRDLEDHHGDGECDLADTECKACHESIQKGPPETDTAGN